jgi:hypothetical protein
VDDTSEIHVERLEVCNVNFGQSFGLCYLAVYLGHLASDTTVAVMSSGAEKKFSDC